MIIRIATPEDAAMIAAIGRETFYETWRPVNKEEDLQAYMKKAFDVQKIKAEIEDSGTNTFLYTIDDDVLSGYSKLRRDRSYPELENKKSLEVERIYVRKEYQDKKVGKTMMDKAFEIAKAEHHFYLWLGVNVDNHKAIRFYEKYGFTIFGEKSFQLGDAVDTDYLMNVSV